MNGLVFKQAIPLEERDPCPLAEAILFSLVETLTAFWRSRILLLSCGSEDRAVLWRGL
jgi:hypothetical protein